jgi:hypothetical protein
MSSAAAAAIADLEAARGGKRLPTRLHRQVVETVTDPDAWDHTVQRWQEHAWDRRTDGGVENILDAYRKEVAFRERRAQTRAAPDAAPAPVVSADAHEAVQVYEQAIGRTAGEAQRHLIAENITDLAVWRAIVQEWKDEDWRMCSVSGVQNMLDRYTQQTGQRLAGAPPRLSDMVLEAYRDQMTFAEYQEWFRRAVNARQKDDDLYQRVLQQFVAWIELRKESTNEEYDH